MTLEETRKRIGKLQGYIGRIIPKWNAPVKNIIEAPTDINTDEYLFSCIKANNVSVIANDLKDHPFDVLLLFSSKSGSIIAHGWFSELFPEESIE